MDDAAKKPGRPRSGRPSSSERARPMGGKGAQVITRVNQDIRSALEAEAERRGESISRVAEEWLDAARRGFAETQGLACAEGLRRMIKFSRLVELEFGDPGSVARAHSVLTSGLRYLASSVMPFTPEDRSSLLIRLARLNYKLAALAEAASKPSLTDYQFTVETPMSTIEVKAATLRRIASSGPASCRDLAEEALLELWALGKLIPDRGTHIDKAVGHSLALGVIRAL